MAETALTLSTQLLFDSETGRHFCVWLKDTYPQVSTVTYNHQQSNFTVKGSGIANDQIRFLIDLEEFIEDGLRQLETAPDVHDRNTFVDVDNLTDAIQPESKTLEFHFDCLGHDPDGHRPILRQIAELTETEVALDEMLKQITVSGNTSNIEQASARLRNLDSAMALISRIQLTHNHHIFLPQDGFEMQIIPFGRHTTAKTIRTLATGEEWKSISAMGILVPFKRSPGKDLSTGAPSSVASRYWRDYTFLKFGNSKIAWPTSFDSDGSSVSSVISRNITTSDLSDPRQSSRPGVADLHIAPDRANWVENWVKQNTLAESQSPIIDAIKTQQMQESATEESNLQQKGARFLLQRRAKPASDRKQSVTSAFPQATAIKVTGDKASIESWSVLKPTKPRYHRTMAQKAASGTKPPLKQVTLEDCWLNAYASFKKDRNIQSGSRISSTMGLGDEVRGALPASTTCLSNLVTTATEGNRVDSNGPDVREPKCSAARTSPEEVQKPQAKGAAQADTRDIEEVFNVMQPAFEAAKCFPGILELELRIELIAVAPFSTNQQFNQDVITLGDWRENFNPDKTSPLAPFWIWSKITADGTDIDSVVDLKWSKKKSMRMFEEVPFDRRVVYEYFCRKTDGSTFVITFDETGQASIQQSSSTLASSTIHFPHRVWDLNLVLKGAMNVQPDTQLKEAVEELVKSVFFEPGNSLGIYCSKPTSKVFSVEKIFMKRWTQHRHLPIDQGEKPNLLLKVLEVQEFAITEKQSTHTSWIRGRIPIDDREQCVSDKRLWFEISIVSDEIQRVFTANQVLELGQVTNKWNPADLLGNESGLKDLSCDTSLAAKAIGASGMGHMYRLGKAVLERMRIGK